VLSSQWYPSPVYHFWNDQYIQVYIDHSGVRGVIFVFQMCMYCTLFRLTPYFFYHSIPLFNSLQCIVLYYLYKQMQCFSIFYYNILFPSTTFL
jgi:hypothetical protein